MKKTTDVIDERSTLRRIRLLHHARTIETTVTKGMETIGRHRMLSPTTTAIGRTTIQGIVAYLLEPPKLNLSMAKFYGNDDGYIPEYVDYDQEDVDLTFATDLWAVAVTKAEGIERNTGKCFNCRELGHYWRECPKPLREDFKCLQEQPKRRQDELNGNGLDGPDWSPQTTLKAKRLLMEFHHVFSLEENEIGCTDAAEHVIELLMGEDEPLKERFRRIAPHDLEEVRQHIQEMLDGGAIRPSQSPWCNTVVLVRKKDGTLRFCIDFRHLNARTKDSHPIPRGPETMESLVGARYFSTMDLKSGFW